MLSRRQPVRTSQWSVCAITSIEIACKFDARRGSRDAMQGCLSAWYAAADAQQQALLACQLQADPDSNTESYLGLLCSLGYEGRLCTTCQPGWGSSGNAFRAVSVCPLQGTMWITMDAIECSIAYYLNYQCIMFYTMHVVIWLSVNIQCGVFACIC